MPNTRPYHKRFRNIDQRTIRATRDLVVAKPWRLSLREQREVAQQFVDRLSRIYGITPPVVSIVPPVFGVYGMYSTPANAITLEDRLSIVTLLHEFRHAIQPDAEHDEREDDARAWSLSVFAKAAPRRFAAMVRRGRILFVTEADL
jgi:hypothetical protein